jgi:hypothetical protein
LPHIRRQSRTVMEHVSNLAIRQSVTFDFDDFRLFYDEHGYGGNVLPFLSR